MTTSIWEDKIVRETGLSYDDILLLPGYTDFKRPDVDLTTRLHKNITLKLPVISAPMDTVTEDEMAIELAQSGGLGIIHRNLTVVKQVLLVKKVKTTAAKPDASIDNKGRLLVGAAVGAGADLEERMEGLDKAEVDLVVVDSGHGNSKFIVDAVKFIKKNYPHIPIMAGNVATYEGTKMLIKAGADMIRVGMGPGSICTTRIITGMGVPQLTAVIQAVKAADNKVTVIADGGIRQMGDMAKALAFGAKAVMLGSLLARFEESPGKSVVINGKKYKQYRGMGSISAMRKGGAERYGQSKDTEEKKLIAEGVEGLVEHKGNVSDYLYQVTGSLRSSLYYIGVKTLPEFFQKTRAIKITQASLIESHPHTITISETGGNYSI